MRHHAALGGSRDRLRIGLALLLPFRERPAGRQVAVGRVMRAGLVGDDVGHHAAADELGEDLRGIAEETHGDRALLRAGLADHRQRLVEIIGTMVEVARLEPLLDAARLALDGKHAGAGEDAGQRLRATHAAEAASQDPAARQVAAEMLAAGFHEGLVGALHDPLAADVDPGPRGHLAVHHEALAIELVEVLPIRPGRHEVRVGDQHARRVAMRAEDADRLAGLHEQRLVVLEPLQRLDDFVIAVPVARGAADAAIDDELAGLLRNLRVEIVHQHAHRRLGLPGAGGKRQATRAADDAVVAQDRHASSSGRGQRARDSGAVTSAVAAAMSGARWRSSSSVGTRARSKARAASSGAEDSSGR